MPIGGVARESRHLESQDDAGLAQTDLGHQSLKSFAVDTRCTRLPEIGVNHDDLFDRPTECDRLLAQGILPLGTLGVLEHLAQARLPDIEVGVTLEVACAHLLLPIVSHRRASCRWRVNMLARMRVSCARTAEGSGATSSTEEAEGVCGSFVHSNHARIHAVIPCCRNSASPKPWAGRPARSRASPRSCSYRAVSSPWPSAPPLTPPPSVFFDCAPKRARCCAGARSPQSAVR